MERYRIADEPASGPLERVVVRPAMPLLAGMLGGFGVGIVWSWINGIALGSATLRKEAIVGVVGLVGVAFYYQAAVTFLPAERGTLIKVAVVGLQLAKLVTLYALYTMQARSFALHEHHGGRVVNGLPALIVLAIARGTLVEALPSWLAVVLG